MVKTENNPDGVPMEVFDMVREQTATNTAAILSRLHPALLGYNRDGAEVKEGVRRNWWRQA